MAGTETSSHLVDRKKITNFLTFGNNAKMAGHEALANVMWNEAAKLYTEDTAEPTTIKESAYSDALYAAISFNRWDTTGRTGRARLTRPNGSIDVSSSTEALLPRDQIRIIFDFNDQGGLTDETQFPGVQIVRNGEIFAQDSRTVSASPSGPDYAIPTFPGAGKFE